MLLTFGQSGFAMLFPRSPCGLVETMTTGPYGPLTMNPALLRYFETWKTGLRNGPPKAA